MRFDEFVEINALSVTAVDQLDGLTVTIAMPPDWEPGESPPGAQVWVWHADPSRTRFCATLVLTQSCIDTHLDPAQVFTMLCDSNAHIYPDVHEYTREVEEATEGPGILGRFGMLVNADIGVLASESLTRVIADNRITSIAQLTLTSLADSPVDRAHIRLAVTPAVAPASAALVDHSGGAPQSIPIPKTDVEAD